MLPPEKGSAAVASFDRNSHPLIRKLESIFRLSDEERDALLNLPMQVTSIRADQDIVREGDQPTRCFALLEGFAVPYKMTGGGKRQIMAFYIAGDIPDLQSLLLKTLDHTIGTLTPCKVGFVQHQHLREICRRFPRISDAFWRNTLVDAAIFREWMASIGRRDAYPRIAHVICEIITKMRAVGLAEDHVIAMPITQGEIADALGLSNVHVNRILTQLRDDGLIEMSRTHVKVPDWERLKKAGDFDPGYLHLENEQVAA